MMLFVLCEAFPTEKPQLACHICPQTIMGPRILELCVKWVMQMWGLTADQNSISNLTCSCVGVVVLDYEYH